MASLIDSTTLVENTSGNRMDGGALTASSDTATHDALFTSMSAQQRIAYLMCERSGLSDHAIAAHLHIGVEDARRLVEKARLELRRLRVAATEGKQTR